MKKNYSYLLIVILFFLTLSSCTTYYIPVDSFRQQFAGFDTSDMRTVITQGPMGGKTMYRSYPIETIKCVDKKGQPAELTNGPSIEIRFTRNNGKRTIFYFDLLRVTDSTVSGTMSRIIPEMKKTILLRDIKKIEVQDGKKKYHYVSR